jgi:hypothetical protein
VSAGVMQRVEQAPILVQQSLSIQSGSSYPGRAGIQRGESRENAQTSLRHDIRPDYMMPS